ncbi:hypothetical protein B0H10DRAFT_2042361 [Mycena sp. CBHHK59/15]|nr:hypothetical protein B0H10DRAFT_2120798 [Mycena sp. CBHHK59/15]KAJ6615162.1 hypothetical protein B0H10DRAFT_2042361 [Mycena sp. CBHHK59/15]
MQAAIGGSTTFTIECINSTTGYMIEVNSGSGFALTAWAAETGSTITPVTYEAFTGRTEQLWTFVPA